MTLTDSIDAALSCAAADQTSPFRLDLNLDQIASLRDEGRLGEPVGPKTEAPGAYRGVNVYPTTGLTELLGQPNDQVRAEHYPI